LKRILPLAAIMIFVWVALIVCVLVIGRIAFEISFGSATLGERIATQIIRLVMSCAAVLLWLVSWKKITVRYFWRAIGRSSRTT
jgi:phosphoglycerol transferase MdoB-like AlkP superfamily enzyme